MLLNDYQERVAAFTTEDELTDLLGLGVHAGALLQAHRNYLSHNLDLAASRASVRLQLGLLLNHVAAIADAHELTMEAVARANLEKIVERAKDHDMTPPVISPDELTGNAYQRLAAVTDQQVSNGIDPRSLSIPMLGLAGEAGTLLVAQKKAFRDDAEEASDPEFLTEELGDLLWYSAAVATHSGFDIEDALTEGLQRVEQRADENAHLGNIPGDLPVLDVAFPPTERFPRKLVFRFRQVTHVGSEPQVNLTLVHAEPNAFPDGPQAIEGHTKPQGYALGSKFGDPLTDNSAKADAYRFHDAIHFGFAAVLGWSPNTRSLLGVKRRSDHLVDDNEDGARSVFAEEGMAAVLAKLSVRRQGFLVEDSIDDDTVDMLTTVLEDLEVSHMPRWLWKRAVAQGFNAMRALEASGGGYLVLNLDARKLIYSRNKPSL